jgi:hypothetical protein
MLKGDTWFKFYVKAIWSPSVRKLTPTQRWVFVTLLALATEGDGKLHGASTEPAFMALACGTDVRSVRKAVAKMRELCLINVRENGDIEITNWSKYQSTTVQRRERKERQKSGGKAAKKRRTAATDKNRIDKNREDIYKGEYEDWLRAWNENTPGPKHEKLGANGIKFIGLLTTEGAADGIVWTLETFTEAVKIYGQAIRAGRWGYKWPSLVDLLSRTYHQKTGPGLTHFLPREGYNPYKDLGLQIKERR